MRKEEQFLVEVASPDTMIIELVRSIVVSGDMSTAVFIHDDVFGEYLK